MDIVKQVLGSKFLGVVIFVLVGIVFLTTLGYFQDQIDDMNYTVVVNQEGQTYYREDLPIGEEFRSYEDQAQYDLLVQEISMRRDIGVGSFVLALAFGLWGTYDLYKNKRLEEAARLKKA